MKRIFKHLFRQMDNNDIDIETLKRLQNQGTRIVDVRSKREYEEGHINGSINIPEYEINSKFEKIFMDYNETIILYCSTGARSKRACKKLIKKGYTNIYNLYGGIESWKREKN